MSTSINVGVTRTTTTTTTQGTSAIILNSGYLKTTPGILKLIQVALGIICVGIAGTDYSLYSTWASTSKLYFLLMVTTFMIGSFINLLSCLASLSTGPIMSKTIYEVVFNSIAFGMIVLASLILLIDVIRYRGSNYGAMLAASIIGFINALVYLVSTVLAQRTYRGM